MKYRAAYAANNPSSISKSGIQNFVELCECIWSGWVKHANHQQASRKKWNQVSLGIERLMTDWWWKRIKKYIWEIHLKNTFEKYSWEGDQDGLGAENLLIKSCCPRIALVLDYWQLFVPPLLLRRVWALVYCVIAPVITYKLAPSNFVPDKKLSFVRLMAELAPTEDSRHHNTKHATPVKSVEQQIDLRMIQRLTKMTGETPEVRSDKRKPREKKERKRCPGSIIINLHSILKKKN